MQWGLEHMEIRNRLFPYPVLCVDNDDYIDSEFYVENKLKEELTDISFSFNIFLNNNEELQFLIQRGYAEFIVHIECSSTAYRTILRTSGNSIKFHIPKSKVNNEVVLLGAIVAKEKISGFRSKHLNEDYDEEVNFEKGAILAYYNLPKVFVTKNYEELAGDNAFFTVIKRVSVEKDEQHPVVYDITDAKIKILVDEEIYNEYIKYHANPNMEPLTNALLVMPALVYMLDTLHDEDIEKYKPLYWYQKINKSCQLQGLNFEEDLIFSEDKTSIEIAQNMLRLPITRAFLGLSRVMEE